MPGTYSWNIAIPDSNLDVDAKYVLRFKQPAATYDPDSAELSSPGFLVLKADNARTSMTTPLSILAFSGVTMSSTSTSSSPATATSSSPSLSLAATANNRCSPCGLSSGGKAGIGIGVMIGVLALVSVAYFVFIRQPESEETCTETQHVEHSVVRGRDKYRAASWLVELPTRGVVSRIELPGSSGSSRVDTEGKDWGNLLLPLN
ncbi:MAG: hypothetical protein M1818_004105 [Claussenomyces sp. TS43310]|nr:MAG: hypothetical protein M1818_004105 [Claussenomyces sp. TS43310]